MDDGRMFGRAVLTLVPVAVAALRCDWQRCPAFCDPLARFDLIDMFEARDAAANRPVEAGRRRWEHHDDSP
jgi:hypothetical protein